MPLVLQAGIRAVRLWDMLETDQIPLPVQDGLTFSSLTPSTTYYIFARSKTNTTHDASTASTGLLVTTDDDPSKEAGAAGRDTQWRTETIQMDAYSFIINEWEGREWNFNLSVFDNFIASNIFGLIMFCNSYIEKPAS